MEHGWWLEGNHIGNEKEPEEGGGHGASGGEGRQRGYLDGEVERLRTYVRR